MPRNALVWFKRDLRLRDHQPLVHAAMFDACAGVYIIEPEWLACPEFDSQHLDFVLQSLLPLRTALAERGLPLLVRVGSALPVLESLQREFHFTHLLSHEETGSGWTYQRDIAVARWCKAHQVQWQEWAQTGVVRRLQQRGGWAKRWQSFMDSPRLAAPKGFAGAALDISDLPTLKALGCSNCGINSPSRPIQAGGERAAWEVLNAFVQGGAMGYRRALSSPLTAETGCSRLSAHLAYGTVSMRCVHQSTEAAIAQTTERDLAFGLRGFAGRLRWHCHFMQKLEDEPAIEFQNFSRAYDGLREAHFNRDYFDAWCEGQTGYPMVDACMRSLRATGWLNFRMRAMLVSFASNHLWLHWRETGQFLARQFLDFEPGIHWSQMQMQSGTTGINTFRIYSPRKQAEDHDPQGVFINRWVPEFGTAAYPSPIVDERIAVKFAKDQLYGVRGTNEARASANTVQERHGSRKSGLPAQGRIKNTNQQRKPPKPRVTEPSPQLEMF